MRVPLHSMPLVPGVITSARHALRQETLQSPVVAEQLLQTAQLWSILCSTQLIDTLPDDLVADAFRALLRAACQLPPGHVGHAGRSVFWGQCVRGLIDGAGWLG